MIAQMLYIFYILEKVRTLVLRIVIFVCFIGPANIAVGKTAKSNGDNGCCGYGTAGRVWCYNFQKG